ncbi:hypothetical protein SARC_00755 [Sphaeroforma arctica JP610]|uniref:Uncharacterized protein n=1 Tax=Sphaeroforma arctica JP610 TaxID=667725 RepID=A0A0L0GDQ1_9EUKA|nr:hypothetical protein SARC_00755 [Sphaeroforma arctica JP610]KNC87132.1 hypothetical protein SARC_00755 [Sphaeroforma arctica JP610]|eukprot:XP_014161034.1 hypothetical protein SARC_00755 [Sphaeroforma arctica JP610]
MSVQITKRPRLEYEHPPIKINSGVSIEQEKQSKGNAQMSLNVAFVGGSKAGLPAVKDCCSLMIQTGDHADSDRWGALEDMPQLAYERTYHSAGIAGECIVACGGYKRFPEKMLCKAEMLRPGDSTWLPIADLPENRCGHGAGHLNNQYVAVSGYGCKNSLQYSAKTDEWLPLPALKSERYRVGVASVGDHTLYAIGGWCAEIGSVQSTALLDSRTDSWTKVAAMETARHGFATAYCDRSQQIYTIGGVLGTGATSDAVERYDIRADTWETLPSLPEGINGALAVSIYKSGATGADVYVFGGAKQDKTIMEEVRVYDSTTNEWGSTKGPADLAACKNSQLVILAK